jgi:hypothetical protein
MNQDAEKTLKDIFEVLQHDHPTDIISLSYTRVGRVRRGISRQRHRSPSLALDAALVHTSQS